MDKAQKEIMVVERDVLFRYRREYLNGFLEEGIIDFKDRILRNYKWKKRGEVEKDFRYKQPIAYSVVINPEDKKIFLYKRAKTTKERGDERLEENFSWGVGGHIEKEDISKLEEKTENPIFKSLKSDLSEEVGLEIEKEPKILGYINDDSNEVGRVHFGLLYVVYTNKDISPRDPEISKGEMVDIQTLENLIYRSQLPGSRIKIDSWSKIAFPPLSMLLK